MNVSLTPELEAFVHQRVKSGRYNSASEVIRESLRLLEEKDRLRLEELRREIAKGIEDLEAGRYTTLKTDDDYKKLADEVKTEGRRLYRERQSK